MKHILLSALAGVTLLCIASCKKNDPTVCTIDPGTYIAPSGGTVIYSVTKSGQGIIDSVIYYDATGPVKIISPAFPYHDTVNVNTADTVRIIAMGTATDGTLTAGYSYTNGVDVFQDSEDCSSQ